MVLLSSLALKRYVDISVDMESVTSNIVLWVSVYVRNIICNSVRVCFSSIFKCLLGIYPISYSSLAGFFCIPLARCILQKLLYAATRAHHILKLEHIYSRTDLYKNSFLPRSKPTWNDLHIPNIDTISLDDFKKELAIKTN